MNRGGWFVVGLIIGVVVLAPLGAFLAARLGRIEMAATAKPLPLERKLAKTAQHASMRGAAKIADPLPENNTNYAAGAEVYLTDCAVCHGLPGQAKGAIASGEFPDPPQLFVPSDMVTDDPEGITYWKVTNGLRLSGMPSFGATLSEMQRWQVSMLVAHADKIPDSAKSVLAAAAN